MAIFAGYTQGQLGLFWKDADNSGPYAFDGTNMVLWDGSGGTGIPTPSSYTDVDITNITTSAVGATWVTFGAAVCVGLDIVNASGTAIEYRRNGVGTSFVIPDGASRFIEGITNANQVSLRRVDQSNTQVTLSAETFAP